jgi:tetratricopeptide (TPR) repeat protein
MNRSAKPLLLIVSLGCIAFAQPPAETAPAPDNKAGAYYNFAMGRVYAELAQAYGNKPEYIAKSVQHYQEALKLDPAASIVFEELTDLYIQTNQLRSAVAQAEEILKQNPENMDARRMLGKIYMRMIGAQDNKINEDYLKKAIEQYQKITAKESKDAESWVLLGNLYRVSNNSVDAEKAYNQALQAEPDNDGALTGLAMLYSGLGDNKRAIEKLKAATDKSPNERSLTTLATAYEQMHDYKNAAQALRRALELAPDNVAIQKGLAEDLLQSDQLDEALQLYQQLAIAEPRDPSLKRRISAIYRVKKDFVKARETLNQAKALDAANLDVRYDEVKLLEAEGKTEAAIAAMKALVDETVRKTYSPEESARRALLLEELGILYRSAAHYPLAVETFRKVAALDPDAAARISVRIIDTYNAAKDTEGARREIETAATQLRSKMNGKNDREVHLALAQIYEKGKRFTEEAKALDEAEKLSTTNEDKEALHFTRGAMYERMKKVDAAEAEFRQVLALNPESPGALNYLGYMLVDHNLRVDEATQMIKKALEMDPDNGAYLDSLGWAYYRQGKLDEAETLLVRALDRIGQDATVHDHLGDVYFKLGKTKEAISQWQASLKDFQTAAAESDPDDIAKVARKLDAARVRLAKEAGK